MISQERWNTLLKREQLLHIGSEIMRAKVWQKKEQKHFINALHQGIALIGLSLNDPKWQPEQDILKGLRNEMECLISGTAIYDVEILYNAL